MRLLRLYSEVKDSEQSKTDRILSGSALALGAGSLGAAGLSLLPAKDAAVDLGPAIKALYSPNKASRELRKELIKKAKNGTIAEGDKVLAKMMRFARAAKILGGASLGVGSIYATKKLIEKSHKNENKAN